LVAFAPPRFSPVPSPVGAAWKEPPRFSRARFLDATPSPPYSHPTRHSNPLYNTPRPSVGAVPPSCCGGGGNVELIMTLEEEHADILERLGYSSTSDVGELMAKAVDVERRLRISRGLDPQDPAVYGAYWSQGER
jgi:hypothetical protein